MKKSLKFAISLFFGITVLAFISCNGNDLEYSSELPEPNITLQYELSADGTYYAITDITICNEEHIIIPSTYLGLPVKSIGERAFYECNNLINLTLPNSITSIGECAFGDCEYLTTITLSDSITNIAERAFWRCANLTNIQVSENNLNYKGIDGNLYTKDEKTLIQYAIGKTATEFSIPNSVTTISNWSFAYCDNLKNVIIDNSVTHIGDDAFFDCNGLTHVIIGDSVTNIGYSAFDDCDSLTNVIIGNSVTKIDCRFSNCDRLENLIVDAKNSTYKDIDGNLYTKDGKTLIRYAVGKTETEFSIPDSVKSIEAHAFSDARLTNVTIPTSVTSIGYQAFFCFHLRKVIFGNTEGWSVVDPYAYVSGVQKNIPSTILADPLTAANCLRNTYNHRIWTREE